MHVKKPALALLQPAPQEGFSVGHKAGTHGSGTLSQWHCAVLGAGVSRWGKAQL